MKLLKLAELGFTVLAVYDENDDECRVLASLRSISAHNQAATRMLHKLMNHIPEAGPNYRNPEKVKKLKGAPGIWEFREQPKKGPKVRTLFFKDGNQMIICTNAFEKRGEARTADVDLAIREKDRYFEDKRRSRIEIEILENDDG
jgi:hypothetical protein